MSILDWRIQLNQISIMESVLKSAAIGQALWL